MTGIITVQVDAGSTTLSIAMAFACWYFKHDNPEMFLQPNLGRDVNFR